MMQPHPPHNRIKPIECLRLIFSITHTRRLRLLEENVLSHRWRLFTSFSHAEAAARKPLPELRARSGVMLSCGQICSSVKPKSCVLLHLLLPDRGVEHEEL